MLILETILVALWVFLTVLGYEYFRHLFRALRFDWNKGNRFLVAVLCLSGPAAFVCALAVDFSRPMGI